jgi:hypothetical protein
MTELIWNGKYDEKGNLKPVDKTILPFQVVETVNESKADREKAQRDLFIKQAQDSEWRNILIWGDNKVVMSSLLPRHRTFHSGWQSFRTRKNPNLETKANHTCNSKDDYNGSVRVVDIFCNDTAKSVEVRA